MAPRRVVRATSVAEVQEAVREGRSLVASGLGAHLDVGAPPRELDTLLRLDGLDGVVDHQPGDMTVTVEAGCRLAALADALAAAGQWLPLDPPLFARTTVGGLVAANLAGPLRASQGTVRDLLLGIAVVGESGAVVRGGSRVVKNVAGYDLPKLHVGALGTLGVVVEATFKVRPRPEREAAVVLPARDAAQAVELALAIREAMDPLWIEAGALPAGAGVAVGLGGTSADVDDARRRLGAVAQRGPTEAHDDADAVALRETLAGFPVRAASAMLRASTLPTDLPGVVEAAQHALGSDVPLLAHVASGIVHVAVGDVADVASAVESLRAATTARGGFLVVERATPPAKAVADVWGDAGESVGLMRRVKAAFDPHGVFAPGRFVGGL